MLWRLHVQEHEQLLALLAMEAGRVLQAVVILHNAWINSGCRNQLLGASL